MNFSATTFRKDLKDPRWPSAKVLKIEKGKNQVVVSNMFYFHPY